MIWINDTSDDDLTEDDSSPLKSPLSSTEPSFFILTRTRRSFVLDDTSTYVSKGSQTDSSIQIDDISEFPKNSTRKKVHQNTLCHPAYLQAGLLMMSLCNQSANQAVMNMFIIDTVIYKQTRMLPLRLQNDYQRQLQQMKRYRAGLECRDDEPVLQQLLPSAIPEEERENSTLTSDDNDEIGDWQSIAASSA